MFDLQVTVEQPLSSITRLMARTISRTFYLNFWSTVIIFLTEKARVLESLHDDGLDLAGWVYHPDPVGVFVRIWLEQEDVLNYDNLGRINDASSSGS